MSDTAEPNAIATPTATDSGGLRIGVIMPGLRTDGGAERLVHTLLEELRDGPHSPSVMILRVARPDGRALAEANGAMVVELPGRRLWSPRRFIRLLRALRRERVDVIHTHLTSANILGILAGTLLRVPTVVTLHNTHTKADDHWYHGRLETFLTRRWATRVIAVGQQTADARSERLHPAHVHVLPNAVPPAPPVTDVERAQLREDVMTDVTADLVITAGRLHPQKAHIDLIDAVAKLRAEGRSIELAIAGRGALEAQLRSVITERDLGSFVHLLGSRPDARELMAAADLFALSSHWEGLPVAILEAMASGTPIVATTVGDVPAVLDEATSRLVAPHDPDGLAAAIAAALDDPAEAAKRADAAAEVLAAKYGSAGWADRTIGHYRAALTSTHERTGTTDR